MKLPRSLFEHKLQHRKNWRVLQYVPLMFLIVFCANAVDAGEGIISFEAESVSLSPGWKLQSGIEGFSGSGYLQWVADDTRETGQGLLIYPFEISKSGAYQMNVRCHQGGAAWDAANDMFVQIPTANSIDGYPDIKAPLKAYVGSEFDYRMSREERMTTRQSLTDHWRWWLWGEEVRSVFRFYLHAGSHELLISGRSKGFIIDKIVIFPTGTVDFEQQPPEAFFE